VAERLKAPVLKTGNGQPFVGSNPTSSAIKNNHLRAFCCSMAPARRDKVHQGLKLPVADPPAPEGFIVGAAGAGAALPFEELS
jgi:hypothetical protein